MRLLRHECACLVLLYLTECGLYGLDLHLESALLVEESRELLDGLTGLVTPVCDPLVLRAQFRTGFAR